jgi:SAM-dependent methyltransferase
VANEYSRRWFDSFLETIPDDRTANEVVGITRRIPLPTFRKVLDVCCGTGRHAGPLAGAGYEVIGVDRDPEAIAEAVRRVPTATFQIIDQRGLASLDGPFDAAMILWQSFGYFDSATNDQILSDLAGRLRCGGRLLLDLYHPAFIRAHLGTQTAVRAPECRSITNTLIAGRLISTIAYLDGSFEVMDFELFEPDDLAGRARDHGFSVVEICTGWDGLRPPSDTDQRYQIVLERTTG